VLVLLDVAAEKELDWVAVLVLTADDDGAATSKYRSFVPLKKVCRCAGAEKESGGSLMPWVSLQ